MKKIVKHIQGHELLTVRCDGKRNRTLSAWKLKQAGLGDLTVQEDGKTVWCVPAQYQYLGGAR